MRLRIQVPDVSLEGKRAVFWGIYWAIAAGAVSLPFIIGALVLQFLPYSTELAYGLWLFSFILLISAGYGAFSLLVGEEAKKRGYPWKLFFWLSIGLSPFLLGVIVSNLPRKIELGSVLPRVCFGCQRPLLPRARFCSACGQLSPLLVEPVSPEVTPLESPLRGMSGNTTRANNIVGGVGALVGSLVVFSLYLLAADLLLDTGGLSMPDLLYMMALGPGLAILGTILLYRGLRGTKK